MRVLIVEDEAELAESLREGLDLFAIVADIAQTGDQALELVSVNDYDALVLDRDLPGMHGDQVCRHVVEHHPDVRVLMLTAAAGLKDKVNGFHIGADDYMTKPFELEELVARLRSLNRRLAVSPPSIDFADITLDPFRREVFRAGRTIRLTKKQFLVLEALLRAQGGVVSAEVLIEKAWDANADPFTVSPRLTIHQLRRALGKPALIQTVTGVGYRLVENEEDA